MSWIKEHLGRLPELRPEQRSELDRVASEAERRVDDELARFESELRTAIDQEIAAATAAAQADMRRACDELARDLAAATERVLAAGPSELAQRRAELERLTRERSARIAGIGAGIGATIAGAVRTAARSAGLPLP
jgi:hypothetical protein